MNLVMALLWFMAALVWGTLLSGTIQGREPEIFMVCGAFLVTCLTCFVKMCEQIIKHLEKYQ